MQEDKPKNMIIASQYKMRYYRNEFPIEGQLVMGQSIKSEQNGCYVALLEYNGQVGMLPINQYTTTMRRAIHRAMKTGKRQILRVIRVDKEKGYIDLSKKQVNVDDQKEGEMKYANSTQLHSILIHIAQTLKMPILQLYQQHIWPLYENDKYDHPLTLLKNSFLSEEKMKELGIKDEKVQNCLVEQLKRRFKRPIVKTMANFSASCRRFEGIHAIKQALNIGIAAAKEKGYQVKIFIIGAPKYCCEVSSVTIEAGKDALNTAIAAIEKKIKQLKGDFTIDKTPYVVGDTNQHIKEMLKEEEVAMVVDQDDDDMGEADD